MSKIICDYCGTMYDPAEGPCPICGGEPASMNETQKEEVGEAVPVATTTDTLVVKDDLSELHGAPAAEQDEEAVEAEEVLAENIPVAAVLDEEAVEQSESAEDVPESFENSEEPGEDEDADHPVVIPVFTEDLDITLEELNEPEAPEKRPLPKAMQPKKRKKRSSRGKRILCGILALLVVLFALYIGYRFARPYIFPEKPAPVETTEPTAPTTEPSKDCTGISLPEKVVTLSGVGDTLQLEVTLTPADTKDKVTFVSDNPAVATVSTDGLVTAVGPGRANITITCGNVITGCTVDCDIVPETSETEPETEPTEPETTEPETTAPSVDLDKLSLNRTDMTFFSKGESFRLKLGDVDSSLVKWSVGNTKVATISESGKVVAVAAGYTIAHAEYEGREWTCEVRVKIEDSTETTASTTAATTAATESSGSSSGSASISATDVTIHVGESFYLRLKDGNGDSVSVTWTPNNSRVCSADGNKITGLDTGMTEVHCTYKGQDYYCLVRVLE